MMKKIIFLTAFAVFCLTIVPCEAATAKPKKKSTKTTTSTATKTNTVVPTTQTQAATTVNTPVTSTTSTPASASSTNKSSSVLGAITSAIAGGNASKSVSNDENVAGLKSSLNTGIEKAVAVLGAEDGFYKNLAYKILIPKEAQSVVNNVKLIPAGQDLVDKAELALNRTAEDAVKSAVPVFVSAIKGMSITDAVSILFGSNDAATQYLKKTTYNELKAAFAPKVKASLAKPLVAGFSTSQTWSSLTGSYNKVANSPIGAIKGMQPVQVNLEDYVTDAALNALFSKVAEEEKSIRTNPAARATDLLKSVFGQLDKK